MSQVVFIKRLLKGKLMFNIKIYDKTRHNGQWETPAFPHYQLMF